MYFNIRIARCRFARAIAPFAAAALSVFVLSVAHSQDPNPEEGDLPIPRALNGTYSSQIIAPSVYQGKISERTSLEATLTGNRHPLPNRTVKFLIRWYPRHYSPGQYDASPSARTNAEGVVNISIRVPRNALKPGENIATRRVRVEFPGDSKPINNEVFRGRYVTRRLEIRR